MQTSFWSALMSVNNDDHSIENIKNDTFVPKTFHHFNIALKAMNAFVFQALKSVVLYVILSPYDNEQSDLVHRISADKKLEEIPKYK